ncbi:spore germination protein GerPB [Virgibacillus sp. C22-A2]|uniref:Spore germination protein GerPB n=1 Tax=Virgibacillus tibetensis TaxID=3042313 RepID=A0ABU6KEP5_9BACI|nr:spore germination protein GerPB [Virgibacillus sp. C22-A2]
MNITVHQTISIYMIKIGVISNSSILQIGSAGNMQAQSDIYNTGEFTEPIPPVEPLGTVVPLVPLAPQ